VHKLWANNATEIIDLGINQINVTDTAFAEYWRTFKTCLDYYEWNYCFESTLGDLIWGYLFLIIIFSGNFWKLIFLITLLRTNIGVCMVLICVFCSPVFYCIQCFNEFGSYYLTFVFSKNYRRIWNKIHVSTIPLSLLILFMWGLRPDTKLPPSKTILQATPISLSRRFL